MLSLQYLSGSQKPKVMLVKVKKALVVVAVINYF
jgi:hypothetical protein